MLGVGAYLAASSLYFTSIAGLSAGQVGGGLAFGSLVGLAVAVPIGHMADRLGPREVYIASQVLGAAVSISFIFARSFWMFSALASLSSIGISASQSSQGALISGISTRRPTKFRSYLRAIMNLAFALGGLLAGVVIQDGSRGAYMYLLICVALSYVIPGILLAKLPRVSSPPRPSPSGRRNVFRDRAYLVLTALNGVTSMYHAILTFGLPLWIVQNTDAPKWLAALSFFINTAIVALFQVRASRGIDTVKDAGRRLRPAAAALLISIVLMGSASEVSALWAVVLIAVAVVGYSIGEIWHSAASYEVAFGLAPAYAQGQYYGAFNTGQSAATAFAPLLISAVCLNWGFWGWVAFASTVSFSALSLGQVTMIRWQRSASMN